jgi:hypothetical protein
MTPIWHLVDRNYTTIAEIKFRDEHIEGLPQRVSLDSVKYALDRAGGFYMQDPPTNDG